jgi:hypothetical protein
MYRFPIPPVTATITMQWKEKDKLLIQCTISDEDFEAGPRYDNFCARIPLP